MIFGSEEALYKCEVDQIIVGIDQIGTLDYQRAGTPGISDPRRAKVRLATEQMKLHMDRVFAEGYFKTGIWTNEYTGVTALPLLASSSTSSMMPTSTLFTSSAVCVPR